MKIRIINEKDWEKNFDFDKSIIRIGSQITCDIHLQDSSIQPLMMQIVRAGGNEQRYTMRFFAENMMITRGEQIFPAELMTPYDVLDGDKISFAQYRMILSPEDDKVRVRTSPHMRAELLLSKRELNVESAINGLVELKNLGTEKPCQFRMRIRGIEEKCVQSSPLPYLYPGASSSVGFVISHLHTMPYPGFHTVTITINAPDEYFGESLEFHQDIYVAPVFDNEIILEDDSENLTGFNQAQAKEKTGKDQNEETAPANTNIIQDARRMNSDAEIVEDTRSDSIPVLVHGSNDSANDPFVDEPESEESLPYKRVKKKEEAVVIRNDEDVFDESTDPDAKKKASEGKKTVKVPPSMSQKDGQQQNQTQNITVESPVTHDEPKDSAETVKIPEERSGSGRNEEKIPVQNESADNSDSKKPPKTGPVIVIHHSDADAFDEGFDSEESDTKETPEPKNTTAESEKKLRMGFSGDEGDALRLEKGPGILADNHDSDDANDHDSYASSSEPVRYVKNMDFRDEDWEDSGEDQERKDINTGQDKRRPDAEEKADPALTAEEQPEIVPEETPAPKRKRGSKASAEPEENTALEPADEEQPEIVPEEVPASKRRRGSKASAEPEETSEPQAESEIEPASEPEETIVPDQTAEGGPEPNPEETNEPQAESEIEPASEPEETSVPELTAEDESGISPEETSEPQAEGETEAVSEPEETSVPELTAEDEPETSPEETSELQAENETEAASEPEETSEPQAESETEAASEPEETGVPEQTAEDEPEPTPEETPEPQAESETEPASAEPEETGVPEQTAEDEPELTPEETPEPQAESETEAASEPEETSVQEQTAEDESETSPEEASEPQAESETEAASEPEETSVPEQTAENETETTSEEASEPQAESEAEAVSVPEETSVPELTAEDEPEISPEETPEPQAASEAEAVSVPEEKSEPAPKAEKKKGKKASSSATAESEEKPEAASKAQARKKAEAADAKRTETVPASTAETAAAEKEPKKKKNPFGVEGQPIVVFNKSIDFDDDAFEAHQQKDIFPDEQKSPSIRVVKGGSFDE